MDQHFFLDHLQLCVDVLGAIRGDPTARDDVSGDFSRLVHGVGLVRLMRRDDAVVHRLSLVLLDHWQRALADLWDARAYNAIIWVMV